jgi:hypothetical protein
MRLSALMPLLKRIIILVLFLFSRQILVLGITLYSYQSGNWNDSDTWTTDPGGTTLIGSQVPANSDIVVILSSRTVILTSNIATTGLNITINSGGILDQGTYRFSSALVALSGQGILKLASINFPAVTTNTFVNAGGGTVEYDVLTGTVIQPEYNNLKIKKTDNNANSYTVTLGSDVIINGDFEITRTQGTGTITVAVGDNTTSRTISITGDFTISSGGILNISNYNTIHNIILGGDLINNGSIDLSNSAQYSTASNGAAIFTFNGESDNALMCNGTTDFYRLILDKGTDCTYILTVTSSSAANFRLFGPVTSTGGDWSTLPLVLQNGTLKLRSSVNIPVLGKNTGSGTIQEFHIPGSAGLWIDGATVSTSNDGGGWRGITIYGLFRITSGSFTNPNNTGGITYFGNVTQPGYILIEGGTVNTTQVKQADINGRVTYHQTGGSLRITGYSDSRNSSAVFALPTSDFVYIMTGGSIYISGVNTTTTNGIDIRASSSNCNVTGGTFTIVRPSGSDDQTNFHIYSTAPFYNLILKDTSAAGSRLNYQLQNNLVVLNDFTIQNRTLDAANYNVTVGGDFTVTSGGTYTPGTNTTTFNGSGDQTFSFNGTVTSGFNNLAVNKPAGTLTFSRTTPTTLAVRGTFDLIAGILNDGGNTITVAGNITNSGTHTGSGVITLNGTNTQTIGGNGNGIFEDLTLNNTNASSIPVSLTSNITINGTLTLQSNKIFNIGSYNLNLTSSASISGTFSSTRFIGTNGDIGDKGITKTFNSTSFTFPIGVVSTPARYTRAVYTLSTAPTTYGSVTVIPVASEHPNTTESGKSRSLTYFWRISTENFVLGSATITHGYYYDTYDVDETPGNVTEAGYVAARFDRSNYSWSKGTVNDVDQANNIIGEPGTGTFLQNVSFIDGDYTAGDDNPIDPFGAVSVYYSYNGGGRWHTAGSWSLSGHNINNPPSQAPRNDDLVIIGDNDSIWLSQTEQCGNLQIEAGSVLNVVTYTSSVFTIVSNHPNGNGKIKIGTGSFPGGDFSAFRGPNGGTVEYFSTGSYTIPTTSTSSESLNTYRHLILNPGAGTVITMPDLNLTVYGNLTQGSGEGTSYLNTSVTSRTLTIGGNLNVNTGLMQVRNGSSQNVTVAGNFSISSGATFSVQNSAALNHTIALSGNLTNNGTLTLSTAGSDCNITFTGSASTNITGSATSTTFNNVTVNKGSSQTTTLTANVSGAFSTPSNNWLTLNNGTFRFMRTGNLNITTSNSFTIPSTAGLYVDHTSAVVYLGNDSRNDNDLYLNGKLTLVNGTIYVGPSAAPDYNNDIEYAASGTSEIEIQGGTLIVNGQIRRSSSGTGGVLKYNQAGGSVTINGRSQLAPRAKLEVENDGSEFTMSDGTLTIVRGGGTTYGDLYLRPASGSVTGGTIQLGTQNVGAIQTIKLDANLPLNNLTLDGVGTANTFELMVNPLELYGNLLINTSNSTFNANSLNVTLQGNFTNNGTYNPGTNITKLNGASQDIGGTTETQFYDMVINSSSTVTLGNDITVNNDLTLTSGTFSTSTYDVNIKGDLINNATHSGNSSSGGLLLNGSSIQFISGNGTFGRLELNNAAGAKTLNSISLNQDFLLTNGILNINQYLLTLGQSSNIVGSGYGTTKMIISDGVFSNIGIRKYFASGSTSFTYPIGVTGKYTPALLTINNNSTTGYIRVNAINERHPAVTDPNNVLQYYWEVESNNITNFEGNLELHYSNSDVLGTESDYVAARLIVPPGTDWSKAAPGLTTDNVNEASDIISFDFPAGTSSLGGEYTAGSDAAIPDEVPVYTSNGDGNWDDVNNWTPIAPSGGPNGFIVIIREEDEVSTNGNRRFAYNTTINGALNVGTTYGHNLGSVSGTGTLYLEGPTLPAGRFTSFLNCSGGTLEYGGSSDYTIIADRIDTVKNLYFSGTGKRILPDKVLVVCELLKIDGPTLDNSQYNRKITLLGNIQRLNSGVFTSGTGANATVVFAGSAPQTIGGTDGNFTGVNALNNLEINNSSGLTLNGPLELNRNLLLTDGIITTTSTNLLSMINWNTSVVPSGGSSSSFVSGPFSKWIFAGDDFAFPTGKSNRYGKTELINASDGTWVSEYFNSGYSSTAVISPLTDVSSTEYWHIEGPAGNHAYVKLRWDGLSDVTPLTTQNGLSDIRVAEYNTGTSSWMEKATSASGNDYYGTAVTTSKMDLDEHDYTLASVSSLKAKASFSSTADICMGENLYVVFSKTASSYSFTYTIDGGSDQPVTTTSNPYTLVTSVSGRYRISGFTGGVADTNSVIVLPVPTATLVSDDADNIICEGQSVTFTAGGGSQYNFSINGSSVQNGSTFTYITTALSNDDNIHVVVTNSSGCTDISSTITMTVHSLPSPTLTGTQTVCTDAVETYNSDTGMANYVWSVSGGGTISGGGSGSDDYVTITWTTTGSQNVSVNYEDTNGCSATLPSEISVEVYRRPETGPAYYVPNDFNE